MFYAHLRAALEDMGALAAVALIVAVILAWAAILGG